MARLLPTAADPCAAAARSLAVSPAVAQQFRIRDRRRPADLHGRRFRPGKQRAAGRAGRHPHVGVAATDSFIYRVGLVGGIATGVLTPDELRQAALDATDVALSALTISDGTNELPVITPRHDRIGSRHAPTLDL